MSKTFTAAKTIVLKGDKKNPENAQHIIVFPGGCIELSRTDDDEYWAHIEVYRGQAIEGESTRVEKRGQIVDSRLDYREGEGTLGMGEIKEIPEMANLCHIAVRIRTKGAA